MFNHSLCINVGLPPGALAMSSPGDASHFFNTERFPSLTRNADWCLLGVPRLQEILRGALTPEMKRALLLKRDFTGFPPVRVVLGSSDMLLDHGIALGKVLQVHNADRVVDVRPGGWHCSMRGFVVVPESRTAIAEAASWLRSIVL